MSQNPFLRGYRNLRVGRVLCITYEDDCPPVWRPLHSTQAHLPDDQVTLFPCIFSDDFALITEGRDVPEDLEVRCRNDGLVRNVVYAVTGEDLDGNLRHVGDSYSEEVAREVVRQLSFETGFYSRSWEISTAHLAENTIRYLADLADTATPTGFLFLAFRLPDTPAIGVKLIATPWTDINLNHVEDITAARLRQEHQEHGMPDDLIQVLHLAGQADVRILIFDADAPELPGLPLHDQP